MSDKSGHHSGVTEWAKATAASAATHKHLPHAAGVTHLYNPTSSVLVPSTSGVLYGGAGGGTVSHTDAFAPYASARFQPPPLHHSPTVPQPPPSYSHGTSSGVLMSLGIAPSNVPAPSGFVPPSFPPGPASAATSVLTPNPFVSAVATSGGSSHFHVETIFKPDQFELHKMMRHAVASLGNSNSSVAGNISPAATSSTSAPLRTITHGSQIAQTAPHQQQQQQQQQSISIPTTPGGRHHVEMAAAASVGGAITPAITENVLNAIGSAPNTNLSVTPIHGRLSGVGVKVPDDDKMHRLQHMVESAISENAKQQIMEILDRISVLKPVEKLMLYLRLPGDAPETDPLRHPQNPLGSRSEINHTINWVRSHLEPDPQVSIPKQDVYDDYITYCKRLDIKPLSTADFGKVMKQVFPGIRPRRLGTRGHSRYCYAAMRKTSKLMAPQLPELKANAAGSDDVSEIPAMLGADLETDTESWDIIKTWAENTLKFKANGIKDLASRIKSESVPGPSPNAIGHQRGHTLPKKYGQREPKEKRAQMDLGPLKKRRKKKRKGSSSSESSCNQPQQLSVNTNNTSNPELINNKDLSPLTVPPAVNVMPEGQKPITPVSIKQEIVESPNFQRSQHLAQPQRHNATIDEIYTQNHHQQQSSQLLPMNLAPEQRSVLTRAPPAGLSNMSGSAFDLVNSSAGRNSFAAVKNLTPKLMGMPTPAVEAEAEVNDTVEPADCTATISAIKEEVDDYNPSSVILCKKVRKAQQTKGFWPNQPTVPIITTTAASPPLASTVVRAPTAASAVGTPPTAMNSLMGPPAQVASNSASSPSSGMLDSGNTIPKVASRNMLQLRKKLYQQQMRQQSLNASGSITPDLNIEKDDASVLPENLGLPRERVISICNMDKHELDEYFIPEEEEENSQDQDTELLQYFQMGDAEEKSNSSDAAKIRNPIVTLTPTEGSSSVRDGCVGGGVGGAKDDNAAKHGPSKAPTSETAHIRSVIVPTSARKPQSELDGQRNVAGVCMITTTATCTSTISSTVTATTVTTPTTARSALAASSTGGGGADVAVGSASASLALMSQKHQKQQSLKLKHQNEPLQNLKRKISINTTPITPMSQGNIGVARKNCFMPISPNINNNINNNNNNNNTKNSTTTTTSTSNGSGNGGLFASPGMTRSRPQKPSLGKQNSLDNDCSDPMIGASRRRRGYMNAVTSALSTSASAPPSPSPYHQRFQERRLYGGTAAQQQLFSNSGNSNHPWQMNETNVNGLNSSANLLNEQNSLDFDLFGSTGGGAGGSSSNFTQNVLSALDAVAAEGGIPSLSETQRSQSVPLSQLQRSLHSPSFSRSGFQGQTSSACASVEQTPVPPEFGPDTPMFSENSSSQHSVPIKLDDFPASDSAAIFDEIKVNELLSSPEFSSIAHVNAAATTCSSTGSSSGYSSGTSGPAFGSSNGGGGGNITGANNGNGMNGIGGCGGGIISRSVPSTPLPYGYQHFFEGNQSIFYNRHSTDDDINLMGNSTNVFGNGGAGASGNGNGAAFHTGSKCNNGSSYGSRSSYDVSKSMPTTPITTPNFRFSPMDILLSNTIDSTASPFGSNAGGGGGPSAFVNDSLSDTVSFINPDSLSVDDTGVAAEPFSVGPGSTDAESIMVGPDILSNL